MNADRQSMIRHHSARLLSLGCGLLRQPVRQLIAAAGICALVACSSSEGGVPVAPGVGGMPAGGTAGTGGAVVGTGGAGATASGGDPGTGAASGGSPATGATAGTATGGQGTGGDVASTGGVEPGTGGLASGGSGTGGLESPTEEYPFPVTTADEDGSELWLRFPQVPLPGLLAEYQAAFTNVVNTGSSPTLGVAESELVDGLGGLLGAAISAGAAQGTGDVIVGTVGTAAIDALGVSDRVMPLGPDGYLVEAVSQGDALVTVVAGNTDVGVLYGTYALLRHLSLHQSVEGLSLVDSPKIQERILNHWDNLDRSVERGYAGSSIWNWNALPGTIDPRYVEYARANASIGVNGTVLTNVNATKNNNEDMWGAERASYFQKVQALADVFRPYGIRVYLTAPFNAAGTANPNDAATRQWWVDRMNEIYALIPDFGGLLIKASSEGEPGPSDGATHADGANMLATAIGDRGIVLWRAFVYSENVASDRIRQAHDEFKPLDGSFDDNVFVQVKNGPLDFQPREPFHPLFGDMPDTQLALELQITKEYLGQDTHLAYVGPWYEEILSVDTHASGPGSTVARVIDGTAHGHQRTAIAGVSNIGSDTNWTGSHFNQANWYTYGRMAWNPDLKARPVAEEWIGQTLSNDPALLGPVADLMMSSYQTLVDYMTPLGLVHIMATDHHYGPGPWVNDLDRAEWNPFYYHEADATGIGFDRTTTGSDALSQYQSAVRDEYSNRATVSNDLLLFFHRVGWGETLDTGRTVWEELVHRYSVGVDGMQTIRDSWGAAENRIDGQRFAEMSEFLQIQHWEARWWRDACLTYFSEQSGLPLPAGYAAPHNNLSFYQNLDCPPDRDKPRCQAVYNVEASPAVLP